MYINTHMYINKHGKQRSTELKQKQVPRPHGDLSVLLDPDREEEATANNND